MSTLINNLSNDDIITDLISEVKVERVLLKPKLIIKELSTPHVDALDRSTENIEHGDVGEVANDELVQTLRKDFNPTLNRDTLAVAQIIERTHGSVLDTSHKSQLRKKVESKIAIANATSAADFASTKNVEDSAIDPLLFDLDSNIGSSFRLDIVALNDSDSDDLIDGNRYYSHVDDNRFLSTKTNEVVDLSNSKKLLSNLSSALSDTESVNLETSFIEEPKVIESKSFSEVNHNKDNSTFSDLLQNQGMQPFTDTISDKKIIPYSPIFSFSNQTPLSSTPKAVFTSTPPHSRQSNLFTERGLKLITSGSSIQPETITPAKAPKASDPKGTNSERKQKKITVTNNGFFEIEEGDLDKLFHIETPKEQKTFKRKFDVIRSPSPKALKELRNIPRFSLKRFQPTTYQFPGSSLTLDSGPEHYSGVSLIDLVANGLNRTLSSSTEGDILQKDYYDSENKDVWIKNLNFAFELDDNIIDQLKLNGEFIEPFDSSVPQTVSAFSNKCFTEDIEQPDEEHDRNDEEDSVERETTRGVPPPTAASLFSLTNDKVMDLFQKLSSKLNPISPLSQKFSRTASAELVGIETHTADSNHSVSPPNSITARLYTNLGSNLSTTANTETNKNTRFIENLQSLEKSGFTKENNANINVALETEKDTGYRDEGEITLEDDTRRIPEQQLNVSNHITEAKPPTEEWNLNNKFVTLSRKSTKKKKTIRTILFTARSKDSASHSHTDEYQRSSWPRSMLKTRSFSRKKEKPKFNLDSGESLKGYAAEYLRKNDLALPEPADIAITDNGDSQKIADSSEVSNIGGFVRIPSNSYFGTLNSDETLGSLVANGRKSSLRSVHTYVPTPAPKEPRRRKSLFTGKRSKSLKLDNTEHSDDSENFVKRNLTIRFAQTPEYLPDVAYSESAESTKVTGEDNNDNDNNLNNYNSGSSTIVLEPEETSPSHEVHTKSILKNGKQAGYNLSRKRSFFMKFIR